MTATLQVRMDTKLKHDAEAVFQEIGLDATTAVRMFYSKVARTQSIPFDLSLEKEREQSKLEAMLLEGLDSPAKPMGTDWAERMKQQVKQRLVAQKAESHA